MKFIAKYVIFKWQEREEEKLYRIYVTDCLKTLTDNTAKSSGGSYIKARYFDLINPPPEDERTPEEVKNYMLKKING